MGITIIEGEEKEKFIQHVLDLQALTIIEGTFTCMRQVPGYGLCGLGRMVFTVGVVWGIDEDECYVGRWCYHSYAEAKEALSLWDGKGDPPGEWIKYKGIDGERRRLPSVDDA